MTANARWKPEEKAASKNNILLMHGHRLIQRLLINKCEIYLSQQIQNEDF